MPDVYTFKVVELPSPREDTYGDYGYWGGSNLSINIIDDNGYDSTWVFCGDQLIANLHRATGEYLVRKAKNARE